MTKDLVRFQQKINQGLSEIKFGEHPQELYEPIRYMISLGGKRMRPLLVLLAYNAIKEDWEKALPAAMSVELFHNFTLIHDDIMDEAPIRRGQPTVHAKWDRNIAILSGDAMLIYAYELLIDNDDADLKYRLRLFNQCSIDVCEGQQLDMNFEALDVVDEGQYIHMIQLKTAVLLGFCLELGALLAGLSKIEAEKMRHFGINMGIGFQLMDDILDVYADKDKFGKQVGGDIISNKKTFLLIKALELAEGDHRSELNTWLELTSFDPKEKVQKITSIYDQLNVRKIAELKMNEYFDKAFEILMSVGIDQQALDPLRNFAKALIKREY